MSKPNFLAAGIFALSAQLALLACPCALTLAHDNVLLQDSKDTKPAKMPTDKQLKKGSKTEKREKSETKKDSLSPANGTGSPPAF